MKALLPAVLAVSCIAVLIVGQMHWKDKISAAIESSVSDPIKTKETKAENPSDPIIKLAANWPKDSVNTLEKAINEKRPYKIQIVGSSALGKGPESWPELVKAELLQSYSQERLEVSILSYDMTSLQFISQNKQEELLENQLI